MTVPQTPDQRQCKKSKQEHKDGDTMKSGLAMKSGSYWVITDSDQNVGNMEIREKNHDDVVLAIGHNYIIGTFVCKNLHN